MTYTVDQIQAFTKSELLSFDMDTLHDFLAAVTAEHDEFEQMFDACPITFEIEEYLDTIKSLWDTSELIEECLTEINDQLTIAAEEEEEKEEYVIDYSDWTVEDYQGAIDCVQRDLWELEYCQAQCPDSDWRPKKIQEYKARIEEYKAAIALLENTGAVIVDTQATEVLDLPALPIASEPEPETQPVSDTDWLEDWYNEIPEPESDTDTQSDSEWLDDWYNQLPEDRIKFKLSFASFLLYLVWLLRSIWSDYRSPCTYQLL